MSDTHIRFEIDSTTAVSYVNGMGGCKSATCDEVAKKISDWCIERGLWLRVVHIPDTTNVKGNALSRRHYSDHEWMLNNDMFSRLCKIFPGLTIDLFASILNHRFYLVMFHGVPIRKRFQLMPLIYHGKVKSFTPFLHLVLSHVAWRKGYATKLKVC